MAYLNVNMDLNLNFHLEDLQNLAGRYHNFRPMGSNEFNCCDDCLDWENEDQGAESSPDLKNNFVVVVVTHSSANYHF